MKKIILILLVDQRRSSAQKIQEILTNNGCLIKTRIGLHDGVLDKCSDHGLIILELVGKDDEIKGLEASLSSLLGVSTKLVEISPK